MYLENGEAKPAQYLYILYTFSVENARGKAYFYGGKNVIFFTAESVFYGSVLFMLPVS